MARLPQQAAKKVKKALREAAVGNPGVAAAAADIAYEKKSKADGRRHPLPCRVPDCEWHTLPPG